MKNQLDKSIIQKVKEVLQIDEDLSSIELLKLLKDYRKRIHPDKFTEDDARKEANEKFKELGNTIDELNRYIENEKLHRGAKELALFEPLYDNVSLQSKLDEAEEKIKDLEEKVDSLKKNNEELNESLSRKQNEELEEENLRLKELYKPSNQKLASLGILFLLSSVFAVMTKVEEVSVVLKKYSPFPEQYLNNVIFGIFILMLLLVIKQYVENKIVSLKVSEVCSPKFSKEFWVYLSSVKYWENEKTKDFAEEDVFYFIHGKDNKVKKIFGILGFKLFQVETSDRLKNFVINTLLNKKLIEISLAKGLDRTFTIKEGLRKYIYYDRD
jgi:hypothetical protein